jgi:hypothetical protein
MIAAEKGYLELTRELIKAGANTNLIDKDGYYLYEFLEKIVYTMQ